MYTSEHLLEKVKLALSEVKLDKTPGELYKPITYSLSMGGKRIRPVMVLLACDMFGGELDNAINAAVAIEIFHNYTLLHDDIMDNAPIRRGKETVYKKWDTNAAILSGDAMFALAYKYLASSKPEILQNILHIFTQAAIEVCEGQQYDMNFETMHNVSIPEYIEMIRLKTAILIAASLKTGAVVARANLQDVENIYAFGENVGLAFQLQDDLLDVFGEQEKFGKKIGGDILTNKKTFLYLKAIEQANGKDLEVLQKYFSSTEINSDEKIQVVTGIYDRINVKQATVKLIKEYFDKAFYCFDKININSQNKTILHEYAEQLVNRRY